MSTRAGEAARRGRRAGMFVGLAALLLAAGAEADAGVDLPSAGTADAAAAMPFAPTLELLRVGRRFSYLPGGVEAKTQAIVRYIFEDPEGLKFHYRATPTLTASEAMEQRAGNCLTLVNLFVALGRAAGLDAFPVEVEDFVSFSRERETLMRWTHVVGGVLVYGRLWTFDFLPDRAKTYRRTRPITDTRHASLFFNAVAVEAMLSGDDAGAEASFHRALDFDPGSAEAWNNYAVLARREGHLDEAEARLEKALEVDRHFLPALTNLARLYRATGEAERAAPLEARAWEEKRQNPYVLVEQSLRLIAAGDLGEAEALLRRARRIEDAIPEIYLAQGRIELLRGDARGAEREFATARKLGTSLSPAFQHGLQRKIDKLLTLARSE